MVVGRDHHFDRRNALEIEVAELIAVSLRSELVLNVHSCLDQTDFDISTVSLLKANKLASSRLVGLLDIEIGDRLVRDVRHVASIAAVVPRETYFFLFRQYVRCNSPQAC